MQMDMFGGTVPPQRAMAVTPQPPRPAREAFFPPAPSPAWERELVTAGEAARDVSWFVSCLWTGIVRESLQGPAGRLLLYRDGSVHPVAALASMHGRLIYCDRAAVLAVHADRPLVAIEGNGDAMRYRAARACERVEPIDPPGKRGP
jgi:hypothetical protein